MLLSNWKKDIFNIPNLLSLLRLCLIPVYIAIYLNAQTASDYYLAAGILTVSCLTDMIDGKIARRYNMITSLGKVLDPIADKATQFTLILCLAFKHAGLFLVMILFVIKESFQLIAGSLRLRKKKMLKGALISGKVCTTVLFISLILMVMLPELDPQIIQIAATIDTVFLLIAFAEYVAAYFFMDNKFQSLDE